MARNIEIKAHARDYDGLRERAAALADQAPMHYRQEDTFFEIRSGRLKLRRFDDGQRAELIFYQRDDRDGPKVSYYQKSPVSDADAMLALLAAALKVRTIVQKERTVYLVGRTRIHLDNVDNLGAFLELEVVLKQDEDEEAGYREAREMFEKLGVSERDLVPMSYADLLDPHYAPSPSENGAAEAIEAAWPPAR
ncbi:class IV adenylate cyclase [Pararobbsia silviterrae]|uniref:CYTH domain-containing protein n=1 Tax=Pararobbsia silviterrae TaxID=1792498 RepID=A0A494Y706_9BURK|nr:class IV adenylate cyclase [Pararobbsia silviterrae]RKP58502.1 CYTH domain-containing protein [Pararobbsia silviterrae]